jgi:DNA-binding transcriptional ArsR family regulator
MTTQNNMNTDGIDYVALKKAAAILRAVNNKTRKQILALLEENRRLKVTEIYIALRMEQSVVSQHLAILRGSNIVTAKRDGKVIYYTLNHARIAAVIAFSGKLAGE